MIATPRLRLRPFGPPDLPAFAAYRADPGVARHQSWDAGYTLADDRNASVQRLLERLGLRREARHVEADWFKGEWTTLRVYAVLAREWGAGASA